MEKVDFRLSLWNWIVVFCKGKFGGGVSSVFVYLVELLNAKVLSKVSPEELQKYGGIIVALAEFGEKVLRLYIVEEQKRVAMTTTVTTLRQLAEALEDGKLTSDELESAVNAIIETIQAWKNIKSIVPVSEDASIDAAEIVDQFTPGEI